MSEVLRPNPSIADEVASANLRFRKLLGVMPGWLWEIDSNFHFTHVTESRQGVEIWPNDGAGNCQLENFKALIGQGRGLQEHIDDLRSHLSFNNFVCPLPASEQGAQWICTSGDPCFTPDGRFAGYQGFAMMVTPIKDGTERAIPSETKLLQRNNVLEELIAERTKDLQIAHEGLQDVLESMDHGVIYFSNAPEDEQVVLMANRRASEILEVPPRIIEPGALRNGLFTYCAARGDYAGVSPEEFENLITPSKSDLSTKILRRTPSGRVIRSLTRRTDNGTIIATFTDVTDLKRREDELESARAAAVAADEAKSEFLAKMSHEIRTPMNGVLGLAELLRNTKLDEQQRQYIEIIAQSGKTLLTIINDVLDISKITAGEMALETAPFRLDEVVSRVSFLMKSAADEKGLRLTLNTVPFAEVLGDEVRLSQILTNLLGNAIKFTETGDIKIDAIVTPQSATRALATLRVSDTGMGIPSDKLDTVFDNFTQVDGTLTRNHEGTGLGLAISQHLVKLMNGEISIDSQLGVGSSFTVKIPFDFAEPQTLAAEDEPPTLKVASR